MLKGVVMFKYKYPKFKKDHLLRTEMLEMLRDFPKDFMDLYFSDCGDGIVCGCDVTWGTDQLSISPGMIYHNKNLYFLHDTCSVDCRAQNQLQYLKVEFLTEEMTSNYVSGSTRITLDAAATDPLRELELCRFHFQEGAKLRCCYESFEDYATEFDTIIQIHVPYCVLGGQTLKPEILVRFADEMMSKGLTNPYDITFAMQVLANHGVMSPKCIEEYINVRLESPESRYGAAKLYKGLLTVRRNFNADGNFKKETAAKRRMILM